MAWSPHGSNADYWRSDNPLLIAWYRFGDEPLENVEKRVPDTGGKRSYVSGLLVDSGPRQYHLVHRGDPDAFITNHSGIAPWSTSGLTFNWAETAVGQSLFVNSDLWYDLAGIGQGLNLTSFGSETNPSGYTFMGWLKIPDTSTNPTTGRQIFGDIERETGGSDTHAHYALRWIPQGRYFQFEVKWLNDGSFTTINTSSDPFPTNEEDHFFFAVRMHRETPGNLDWIVSQNGSGVADIYVGTTVSGLRKVTTLEFTETPVRLNDKNETTNLFTFSTDSYISRTTGTSSARHLPPDSVLDEFCMIADGWLDEDRIAHYMNSGIQRIRNADPGDVQFQPENPGNDNLVAYWTFDDQTGTNSAPNTSGLGLDIKIESVNLVPVAGVRGGSGIRTGGNTLARQNSLVTAGGENAFLYVSRESGLSRTFPDVSQSRQWTWIGWMRAREDSGQNWGGCVGWFAGNSTDHTAWGIGDWTNAFASDYRQLKDAGRGITWAASGDHVTRSNGPSTGSSPAGGGYVGVLPGAWQLWALVFDFDAGIVYSVRDAKNIRIETRRLHPLSGLDRGFLVDDADSAFVLGSIEATNNNRVAEFDDWAIFDKALTLPEMSGYALSGVPPAPEAPIPYGTADVRTLGYWRLNNSGIYTDPSGVSGVRYEDSSFYVHHLSNISGTFSQGTTLNSDLDSDATKLESSGSMISILRTEHGANLDFSQPYLFAQSGFTCGAWFYVPSGDFGESAANTHGLQGDHHIMGAWGQGLTIRSWQLGINNNSPVFRVRAPTANEELLATDEIPFNKAFFIAAQITPSGGSLETHLYLSEGTEDNDLRLVASTAFTNTSLLNPVGASGFSLLNVPNMQQGFPSGTRIQHPFVYAGPLLAEGLTSTKNRGFAINTRASGAVSTSDPNNVSHWRFDRKGAQVLDRGKEQNHLLVYNGDGNGIGTIRAYHVSGVNVRQEEYYSTQPDDPGVTRLDLGSTNSYTVLGWLVPNAEAAGADDEVLFSKHPTRGEGAQGWVPANDDIFIMDSAGIQTSGNNSRITDRSLFTHVAFVHDKDNNRQTVFVNGRYAGSSFTPLKTVPVNTSGFALGGRGSPNNDPIAGGAAFSGILDDWLVFDRALSLPEISGLAANSYNYAESAGSIESAPIGAYISGLPSFVISGLVGAWIKGSEEQQDLIGGYVSGVSGAMGLVGGYIRGKAFVSGLFGGFVHGGDIGSGVAGAYICGLGVASGLIGSYIYGGCQANGEFDITFTFQVVTADDFDAKLAVELSRSKEFDAKLALFRITSPPTCSLVIPYAETVASGTPYTLTARGSGIATNDKHIERVRFTFSDFKAATSGTLVSGVKDNGVYEATRVLDTPGLYTVKIEVIDSYGYRSSCAQQLLLVPSGSESGAYLASLPDLDLTVTPTSGVTKATLDFTHGLSGLLNTSGVLEYTDYGDQQESLVNSLEMPTSGIFGNSFTTNVRQHTYTMPGFFIPVWSVSGNWGIVSETVAGGIDTSNF